MDLIKIKDVKKTYKTGVTAIQNLSLNIEKGQFVFIIGSTGCGKSTLIKMLYREEKPTSGIINIGGEDIRNISSDYLMDKVSFVFQDVFMFKQSIKENIKMGSKVASDEDVYKAAKAAMCEEFIMKLPNGYDTILSEDGIYLSGGEMQRLAIARAIIKNSPIIVLDEATAFADPENEYLIQQALSKLLEGKTVIMIAHRLYTIKNADNIIVIGDGNIIEQGRHDELINNEAYYNEMWKTYTKSSGWTMGKKGGVVNA